MRVEIYMFEKQINKGQIRHDTIPTHRGYIDLETETFSNDEAEKCWDLCNWSCWTDTKPTNLHSDISWCDHGICFKANDNNWLALSEGWLNGSSVEITDYVSRNAERIVWTLDGNGITLGNGEVIND